MPTRSRALLLLAVASVLAAAAVLLTSVADRPAPPLAARADALARELRCPVCGGETVAESQSDVAVAMRAEVEDQLAQGRSPEQVRDWFAQRYGADVVLRPATDGAGLVVWLLPALVVGGGVVVVARLVGAPARRRPLAPAALAVLAAAALAVPAVLAAREPGAPATVVEQDAALADPQAAAVAGGGASEVALGRALVEQGRHAEAVDAYRRALDAGAEGPPVRLLLGLALVRSDRAAEAVPVLRHVLAERPDEAEALLVLAAALRDEEPDEARALLRRFLAVAPDHEAAPGVRRALQPEDLP